MMISTTEFFEAFKTAGMTVPVSWTPSGGGGAQSADVMLRAPTEDVLAGDALGTEYSIQYPSTLLVGLKRGETVVVSGGVYAGVTFKVREEPKKELDGSRMRAVLEKQ